VWKPQNLSKTKNRNKRSASGPHIRYSQRCVLAVWVCVRLSRTLSPDLSLSTLKRLWFLSD
jgi:hypothetical protein